MGYSRSEVHLGHYEIKLAPLLVELLVLREDGRLLVRLQVAVVHLGQGVPLVSCFGGYVFANSGSHAALGLQTASVDGLF